MPELRGKQEVIFVDDDDHKRTHSGAINRLLEQGCRVASVTASDTAFCIVIEHPVAPGEPYR
jgi:hypothetical protein